MKAIEDYKNTFASY